MSDGHVWAMFAANAPEHPNPRLNDLHVFSKDEIAKYHAEWCAKFADVMLAQYAERFPPQCSAVSLEK